MIRENPNTETEHMSLPTPPRPAPHHGYRSWSTFWREGGKKHCRRFGRVGVVTKAEANQAFVRWFREEYQRRQAVQQRADAEAAAEGSPTQPIGTLTVNRLCKLYRAEAESVYIKGGRPTSHMTQVEAALDAMAAAYGDGPADGVGAPEVTRLIEGMVRTKDRHNKDVCLSASTVNGRLRVIKQIYAWGRGKGLVSRMAAVDVSLVKPLRPGRSKVRAAEPVRPVPLAVLEATLEVCPNTVADMIRVQLLTGMRPGELCGMRPCDIDASDPACWVYTPRTHKTEHHGKTRTVPIGPKAQAILKAYTARREKLTDPVFLPEEAHRERLEQIGFEKVTAYQTSRSTFKPGRAFRADTYRNKVAYACDRAFDPDGERRAKRDYSHRWHPHQLRHNYATSVRAEFGVEAASDVLGHSSLNTTLIYAEKSLARAKDIARKVG